MFIPEIPNNSLKDEITQIVELSEKLENDYDFEYSPPIRACSHKSLQISVDVV